MDDCELTGVPFPPGAANVYRVDAMTGVRTVAHTGFTNIVDLASGPDGDLLVLQISANGLASPMGPVPGALIKVDLVCSIPAPPDVTWPALGCAA
jgi:hypothetical protein